MEQASGTAASANTRLPSRSAVGSNIRRLRKAQGRTLQSVASSAGVSVSLLSQVERGVLSPSLDSLWQIADALGVQPSRLLMDERPRSIVVRANEAALIPRGDGRGEVHILSPSLDGAFEIGRWWLPAGAESAREARAHEGEEAVLILEGRVVFELGTEESELGPGDLVTHSATVPHRYRNVGTTTVQAVFVVSPPVL